MKNAAFVGLLLLTLALSGDAGELRKTVVLGMGEQAIYTTNDSIATVTTPPGTNMPPRDIVKFVPQQYGNSIVIKGIRKGEVKLLVESTAQLISEIVTVSVVDKPVADAYRGAVGAMASVDGISEDTVFASGSGVLVTGETHSAADARRCVALEASGSKKQGAVACAARLDSAVTAVNPDAGYAPAFNVTFQEEFAKLSGESTPGSEAESTWIGQLRLGDVPFALIATNKATLTDKCITVAAKLRRAIKEWESEAAKNRVYLVEVKARRTAKGYELAMLWRLDQGSRGDTLVELTFDELQYASRKSAATPDRLVAWWAATLQDSFRLYFHARAPLRDDVAGKGGDALTEMYRAALRLDNSVLRREDAAFRMARGYTAMRWSSGADPFRDFATKVPDSFQGSLSP